MAEIHYQRLTRSRAREAIAVAFQSRSSLWLGPDHLLCVDANGYTENYKRFYFRDIQAIIVRQTQRRTVWNIVLGVLLTICLVGTSTSLMPPANMVAAMIWGTFAVLFAVPLLINNLLGSTCACQLRTAVHMEKLPSLCRLRQTKKVLGRIRPLIAAAQGGE
ncbi:MAG TPA: hypothetical protein VFV81_00265, partial [Verrucomicrobiae bacterium]|nr:hypothetical protein [Verrucomicrobiae bacterium]